MPWCYIQNAECVWIRACLTRCVRVDPDTSEATQAAEADVGPGLPKVELVRSSSSFAEAPGGGSSGPPATDVLDGRNRVSFKNDIDFGCAKDTKIIEDLKEA